MLDGFGESLSDLINSVRYRDAYEDIRRKEEEVEELRRKYEQAEREANSGRQEQERQRRKQQSQDYRKSQKKDKNQSSGQHKTDDQKSQYEYQQKTDDSHQTSNTDSSKGKYLSILGLDPDGTYSYADIKKAYRRQASKHHPDKHHNKGESVWKEMNERFKEIKEAYEWLGLVAD
ncbi:MAG: DnaJ domain-containing protein [Candidatus Thiodiazotropha sp. (ex Lucinoma aequizonata)]|nr:DnaJ domain-containing protein [Candidatus Thiodiazotropha sp. (ex Lucinoma aequizonata)]MCU7889910.1 DnaJ domain-containing protein [Candidatus Thiodiazotropha sp. (ex Lucinoma aequizonata)]MCU7894413.1 DnaJ domain-containing protein [Candidatus Thiodiazotropha sp. (ex Lucinoma aequizonata)]MCU7899815.1 DnaJ domain-containing protein [Candidatus Thiodiazotropha sp. (ex Lucinoma aequizonata)]MCU7901201.1 DnaJ domain-containing protein [Candidatus Thiodiazotropha sp. (ex Lucinoma aequizonata)